MNELSESYYPIDLNSDEYFTRRYNQLRKNDAYKYLPKDDLRNLIKGNVKSMENAFDDLTVKFSKDFDIIKAKFDKIILKYYGFLTLIFFPFY